MADSLELPDVNVTATPFYQGAQDAASVGSDFNIHRFNIDRVVNRISTADVVQIVNPPYDSNGNAITPGTVGPVGFVDVLPLVNQLDGQGKATNHETVNGLLYFRYQGGSNAVITDPIKGDIGVAVYAQNDISSVKSTKAQANPGSRRRFDRADGIFFGMCLTGTPNQYIAFTNNGITIADKNGNKIEMNSNGIICTSAKLTNSGEIIAKAGGGSSVTLTQHTHTQGVDSRGDTEQPTNPPTGGT